MNSSALTMILDGKAVLVEVDPDCGLVFLSVRRRVSDETDPDPNVVGFDINPVQAMELSVALAKAAIVATENELAMRRLKTQAPGAA